MARARNLKPGFFRDAALVELPTETRLLFPGLWTLADREGRLEDKPKQIKMEIFPADNFDVETMLAQLAAANLITRYQVEGKRYIQVVNFAKHQNPHRDEKASTIPPPPEHGASTVQTQCEQGGNRASTSNLQPSTLSTTASAEADADFENAWKAYPKRAGGNPKARALKAWHARRKEGASVEDLTAGVMRYAEFVRTTGKQNTEFVMQAATFFGPYRQFLEPWNPPQEKPKAAEWWSSNDATEAKGREIGLTPRSGEGWPQFRDRIRAKLSERIAA